MSVREREDRLFLRLKEPPGVFIGCYLRQSGLRAAPVHAVTTHRCVYKEERRGGEGKGEERNEAKGKEEKRRGSRAARAMASSRRAFDAFKNLPADVYGRSAHVDPLAPTSSPNIE